MCLITTVDLSLHEEIHVNLYIGSILPLLCNPPRCGLTFMLNAISMISEGFENHLRLRARRGWHPCDVQHQRATGDQERAVRGADKKCYDRWGVQLRCAGRAGTIKRGQNMIHSYHTTRLCMILNAYTEVSVEHVCYSKMKHLKTRFRLLCGHDEAQLKTTWQLWNHLKMVTAGYAWLEFWPVSWIWPCCYYGLVSCVNVVTWKVDKMQH